MRMHAYSIILLLSIILGSITGYYLGPDAFLLKPFGELFLNLLFTAVIPLVFFSIAASVAQLGKNKKLGRILLAMIITFIFTGLIAAIYMIIIVKIFPPAHGSVLKIDAGPQIPSVGMISQITNMSTVHDSSQGLSNINIIPIILFSFITGLIAASLKKKSFADFLQSGTDVFLKVISIIMYFAPIGFFAYFALLIGEIGPQLLSDYFRIFIIYYTSALIYFVFAFSFYAYLGGGMSRVKLFWQNVFIPMTTSFATCSSAASIPVNLQATRDMKVSDEIAETIIPIGAMIHKDGTVLGAIIKISFLFALFGLPFAGPHVLLTAIMVAILVGTVMGAIPSGGMLGEMLILSIYGFPPQALMMTAVISLIIDPLATMLNVTGDSVCAMIIERITGRWSQHETRGN